MISALARRTDDDDTRRHRALIAMRDVVVAATVVQLPDAGSSAASEAVDEALEQLLDAGAYRDDLEHVQQRWISWAQRRLIDKYRSAEFRYRDPIAVDEHHQALSQEACDDPLEVREDSRQWWRMQEILRTLTGAQREWGEAWLRQVLSGSLAQGAQPRGLHDELGWTQAKTKKTAQRARRKMVEFVDERARGAICSDRQALLDAFITASAPGQHRHADADLDQQRYESVLLHIAGCDECFFAWRMRRRTLLARCGGVLMLPLDAILGAAQAITGKFWSGTQQLTVSLLQRLGIGGGAAAGGALTLTGKTAAVCAGLVCAATAGGELSGVLPPIIPSAPQHKRADATPTTPPPATPTQRPSGPAARSTPPPPPAAPASTTAKRKTPTTTTAQRTSSSPTPASTTSPRVTPGDLPLGSSTRPPAPTTSSGTAAPRTSEPNCFPGDLGC